VLVYGGRNYRNTHPLFKSLDSLKVLSKDRLIVIQGGANGADALGKRWSYERGVHCATVPAYWRDDSACLDRSAGVKRNSAMLLLEPHLGIELPGGRGTEDMRRKLIKAELPIWRLYE
jgi:hypothetical protein